MENNTDFEEESGLLLLLLNIAGCAAVFMVLSFLQNSGVAVGQLLAIGKGSDLEDSRYHAPLAIPQAMCRGTFMLNKYND